MNDHLGDKGHKRQGATTVDQPMVVVSISHKDRLLPCNIYSNNAPPSPLPAVAPKQQLWHIESPGWAEFAGDG